MRFFCNQAVSCHTLHFATCETSKSGRPLPCQLLCSHARLVDARGETALESWLSAVCTTADWRRSTGGGKKHFKQRTLDRSAAAATTRRQDNDEAAVEDARSGAPHLAASCTSRELPADRRLGTADSHDDHASTSRTHIRALDRLLACIPAALGHAHAPSAAAAAPQPSRARPLHGSNHLCRQAARCLRLDGARNAACSCRYAARDERRHLRLVTEPSRALGQLSSSCRQLVRQLGSCRLPWM